MSDDPNTLGYHLTNGDRVWAICYNRECKHSAQLDLQFLVGKLGPDFLSMHRTLTPLLRCSACKSKNIGLRLNVNVEQNVGPGG